MPAETLPPPSRALPNELDLSQLLAVLDGVKRGDFTRRMPSDRMGLGGKVCDILNDIIDLNERMAKELEQISVTVGKEGRINERAFLAGASGAWKGCVSSVNSMIADLVQPTAEVARVIGSVAKGDLSQTMATEIEGRPFKGEFLRIANVVNTMVDQLSSFASEVTRVAREVGTEGKLGGQAQVKGVGGTWKDLTDNVNSMARNLTSQVRNIADVTTAVARGDLSKKITVDVKGEILELKDTINTMVDQLNSFASEVTRVAREVGTEGKLGGQAQVKGVGGTWKDLTDSVNSMASNLTSQVRNIARVVTAVANGDMKRKLLLEVKGEIAALADTINGMIDTLALFADQVTTVAREVGVEGKLGGQAKVPGAAGTWRALTDNVNQLAANLTTQVRAIAEVSTAVTKGDLTRYVSVEAQGEVAALKDNINEMIRNLKDTTGKNMEQDWLKTNLTRFTQMLQGQRDLLNVSKLILSELAPLIDAHQGLFYLMDGEEGTSQGLRLLGSYAQIEKHTPDFIRIGDGLIGQCALEKRRILLASVPASYLRVSSGLGEAKPRNIIILPVLFEGHVKAILELASFNKFSDIHLTFLEQLTESIGIVLNTIATNMRTEDLLKQSQYKNEEIELAKKALEEKAEQLALTSKYKSQFLANMSHELRTPLNSLLILAKMLHENQEGNLNPKQVEFSKTIHSSGSDLLALINEILDMSKIESGMITIDIGELGLSELTDYVDRNFAQVAQDRGLNFAIEAGEGLPATISTDAKRLQQVLKNLLSNAFKFTEKGFVRLLVERSPKGMAFENPALTEADTVLAFSVKDSGIGIRADKQKVIFEAFQQGDMTTSRKYGGTGLGLTISREIAKLLGGEIKVESELGSGSTFTLYLPRVCPPHVPTTPPSSALPAPPSTPVPGGSDREELPWLPLVQDDVAAIKPGDRVLMIVEDDLDFALIVLDCARELGFKGIVVQRGDLAMSLALKYKPDAITLDLRLPDVDGLRVLDLLKHEPRTRHIPVHVISAEDEARRSLRFGAMAFSTKPVSREGLMEALGGIKAFLDRAVKTVLVVEDDARQRQSVVELIGEGDVRTVAAETGAEALKALKEGPVDCVVLDLGLSDMEGFDLLEKVRADAGLRQLPVIVYTGRDLSAKEEARLRRLAKSIIVKDARSPERLLAETSLYLHRTEAVLPEPKRKMIETVYRADPQLSGRKVLVVDDDARNIFALTSLLERQNIGVHYAENGRDAIHSLETLSGIDAVLMDIMMPDMDGYETMRAIREIPKFKSLPIIALTAKAMKGDRQKCLEAGASDYIAKPVEVPQLLSLLRVWICR